MWTTNPEVETEKEKLLQRRATVDNKLMARVNRERLAVLLSEAQQGDAGNERYAASLRGESLGTHRGGTTAGARKGIKAEADQR
ncbi:hypothetical protein WJX73_002350 [Symbiochloris irregularis]|uniref:Uncharacterized protein n=1 Tax=Symbiochloris irregularis TaxID=706552 RepID=A0AAW1P8C0_9CHLO